MKTDLHNHLGRNGKNPGFDETIDIAFKNLDYKGAFGICNCTSGDHRFENFTKQKGKYTHDWLDEEKRILYVPEKQIYVVGCEEVQTKQGHLLVAGMPSNKKIQKTDKTLSLEEALKRADDFNGVKIAVHPAGRDGLSNYLFGNIDIALKHLDGWEVYNASAELAIPGFLPFNANLKSFHDYRSLLDEFNVGICSFTDGHSAEVIGRSYTEYSGSDHSNFLESLRTHVRTNHNTDSLHMKPAKWDALKHVYHMAKDKLFKTGA